MSMNCSIDYLSLTAPHSRGLSAPKQLLDGFRDDQGRFGYAHCRHYSSGVLELWDEDRPERHVIYSGKTLAKLAQIMPASYLCQWHYDVGHRCSRIDTAVDVFDSGVVVTEFATEWATGNVKTRSKSGLLISDPMGRAGDTFYVGSLKRRRKLLRIYDKAKEQRIDRDWLRFEMQYGQGAARSMARLVSDSHNLSSTVIGAMKQYVKFKHPLYQDIVANESSIRVRHDMSSGVDKTLEWLWQSVLPVLVRIELQNPGHTAIFHDTVMERAGRKASRKISRK